MKFYIKENYGDRYLGENGVFLPTKEGANIYESEDVYKVISELNNPVVASPVNYLEPGDVSLSDLSDLFIYSERLKRFLKVDTSIPNISESELIGREDISVIL